MSKQVNSIDIGSSKIRVCIAKYSSNGTLVVHAIGEVNTKGYSQGKITDKNSFLRSIQLAIKMAENQASLRIKNIVVNISKHNLISKDISIIEDLSYKQITQKDVNRIKIEAEKKIDTEHNVILSSSLKETYLDKELFDKPILGISCQELTIKYNFIYCQQSFIDQITNLFQECKIKINRVVPSAIASSKTVVSDIEKNNGVILINFGAEYTDMVFYKNRNVQDYICIPFGGDCITKDLINIFKITRDGAEKVKVEYGTAIPRGENEKNKYVQLKKANSDEKTKLPLIQISEITSARVEELASVIKHHLSKNINLGIQKLVITGGASSLKNLTQYLQFSLNLETKLVNPNSKIVNTSTIFNFQNSPEYASVLGLLLSEKQKKEKSRFFSSLWGSSNKVSAKAPKMHMPKTPNIDTKNIRNSLFNDVQNEM
jgi:cell division protein FtsA